MSFFKKLLIFFIFFLHNLYALPFFEDDSSSSKEVLFLQSDELADSIIKGSIFKLKIKILPSINNLQDIEYEFLNGNGIKVLTPTPIRVKESKYIYDTFYLVATQSDARIPDIIALPIDNKNEEYKESKLSGKNIKTISLKPDKNFANIIASDFSIQEYKTTSFDDKSNIVVFVATAKDCDIAALKLSGTIKKQGIESINESYLDSKITYYAIIDKNIDNLELSYFNTLKNNFVNLNIPIVVSDDSVVTQSDLKPLDQSKQKLKFITAIAIGILFLLIALYTKKIRYVFISILALLYLYYNDSPDKKVCLNEGSNIYLLPIEYGTVFEKITSKGYLQKEGQRDGWIKIQLANQKIGWAKNEDICQD